MQYEIEAGGKIRQVIVTRTGATFAVTVDGITRHVDVARIDGHTLSLIVDSVWPKDAIVAPQRAGGQMIVTVDGEAVHVVINGRRRGRPDESGASGSGPQRLIAPMPGKIVRVMVKPGDAVDARQPIVVVEAMKMENEVRAGRGGTVAEVHAREGQSVDAGALLVTIQ